MSYKDAPEWGAMNHIWKNMTADARLTCKADFELIVGFIREHAERDEAQATEQPIKPDKVGVTLNTVEKTDPEYARAISMLSEDAQEYIAWFESDGGMNIYYGLRSAALMGGAKEPDEICAVFLKMFGRKYPSLGENDLLLREIAGVCIKLINA